MIETAASADQPIYRLMYTSTGRENLPDAELEHLLQGARRWNDTNGITGMLIYVEGHFLQIVEGARRDIEAVAERIAADPRHCGIIRLIEGETERRAFSDWSMGFRRLGKSEGKRILGAVDLARQSVRDSLPSDAPQELVVFMESFYRSSLGLRGHDDLSVA